MNLNFWNVLCTLLCVGVSEALRQGDTGVCVIPKNLSKTKIGSAVVKVPCRNGRAQCTKRVTKRQNYFEKVAADGCCDGYEYDDKTDVCQPECRHGCDGGKCVAPETCVCEPPLILVKNKCTPPVCDDPCVNGNCTAPNTCTCNDGYRLKDDNYTCAAQCSNCDNGECTAPNVCNCNKGYSMIENKCTPVCKNECSNGFCASPDVCSCDDGYELINNTCKPACGACVNAACIAPGTCECLAGYKPQEGNKEVCIPKCESCNHGDCVAPNKCTCHEGYSSIDNVCRPRCKDLCVNSHCTSPNECTCTDGYVRNTTEPSICYKPCSACRFGTCNFDGECTCEADMELVNGTCLLLAPKEAYGRESSTPGLAGLEMSWLVGGAVGVLLVVLVIVVINRIWRRRQDFGPKTADEGHTYGSVIYTLPDTLITNKEFGKEDDLNEMDEEDNTEKLMAKEPNDIV